MFSMFFVLMFSVLMKSVFCFNCYILSCNWILWIIWIQQPLHQSHVTILHKSFEFAILVLKIHLLLFFIYFENSCAALYSCGTHDTYTYFFLNSLMQVCLHLLEKLIFCNNKCLHHLKVSLVIACITFRKKI